MHALYLVLYIVAAACFALAAIERIPVARCNMIAFGLFAWVLVPLIQAARAG